MAQFDFKRISSFKWGKTGRGIITIVILSDFFSDSGLVYFLSIHFLMIQIFEMRKLLHY